MTVSEEFWRNYATKLSEIDERAAQLMRAYIDRYGVEDTEALVNYAYRLVQRYGAASTELACEMYETLAEYANYAIPAAVPAEIANYNEVAKVVQGARNQALTGDAIPGAISRLVKQAGADTMLQNAARDHAEWAWVPIGDTCAFCITLASNGWQRASRNVREGLHADHIHGNCDCTFAVRFRSSDEIEGYDPDRYLEMYYDADGVTSKDRINAMRRQFYAENRERILAQKRDAYARSRALESDTAEEVDV